MNMLLFKYFKVVLSKFVKLWGLFFKRKSGNIFCVPNRLCALEPIDVFNYTAENVVSFTNYVINHCEDKSIRIDSEPLTNSVEPALIFSIS